MLPGSSIVMASGFSGGILPDICCVERPIDHSRDRNSFLNSIGFEIDIRHRAY